MHLAQLAEMDHHRTLKHDIKTSVNLVPSAAAEFGMSEIAIVKQNRSQTMCIYLIHF